MYTLYNEICACSLIDFGTITHTHTHTHTHKRIIIKIIEDGSILYYPDGFIGQKAKESVVPHWMGQISEYSSLNMIKYTGQRVLHWIIIPRPFTGLTRKAKQLVCVKLMEDKDDYYTQKILSIHLD